MAHALVTDFIPCFKKYQILFTFDVSNKCTTLKIIVMCLAISAWHTQVNTLSAPIPENRTTDFN